MLRKCICMIVTVALVVCVSVAPVGAVDAAGSFTGQFLLRNYGYMGFSIDIPRVGNKTVKGNVVLQSGDDPVWFTFQNLKYVPSDDSLISGTIGVYFSYAFSTSVPMSELFYSTQYDCRYSLANTSTFTQTIVGEKFNFSTGVSGNYPGNGVQLSFRIPDVDALTSLEILFKSGSGQHFTPSSYPFEFSYYIPSASLVYAPTSSDLDALESVADQIAEGNEIARAMYGDIMSALNALKDDTALMASYINDCLTYLNSIETATIGTYNLCAAYLHNLADIAQTAEDIEAELDSFHTDFMSKLDLLISTITSESDDIQATMDRIYEQLIAWLETNFKEAISPEFEGANDDLSQGIQNNEAIEQEWTGSLSDTWTAMHIEDFTIDASFTSGIMWVSGWFSNIYNSLGLYGSIVILPLIIGICKLLLGYFRFAGHGHSKGGGDVDA